MTSSDSPVPHAELTGSSEVPTGPDKPTRDGSELVTSPPTDEPAPEAVLPVMVGGMLAGYRILKKLGQGGMGMVLEAEDVRLKRRVAMKVMKPEVAANETHRQRFIREAQAAATVEHDHIVPIHQVGEENNVPFIVMPFLKGEPLDVRMKRSRLDAPEVISIGRQTAEGLAAAHKRGLIHRDIKPANIWLESSDEGGPDRVKILDFGLARLSGEEGQLTQSGAIMGTPAYMAPEQARGKSVDHRADLFSLGCVLYEMSTGKRPFNGPDTMAILSSLALDIPADPSSLNSRLPPALSRLIMKLLEKDADNRVASAREVAETLKKLQPENTVVVIAQAKPAAEPSPWADIDASDTEVAAPPLAAPRPQPKAPVSPDEVGKALRSGARNPDDIRDSGRFKKPLLIGAGLIGLIALVVAIRDKGGNKAPDGGIVEVKDKVDIGGPKKVDRPANDPGVGVVPVGRSPFDDLDPAKIPAEERAWAPEKTVAVIGTHRGVFSDHVVVSPDGKWLASNRYLMDAATLQPHLSLGDPSSCAAFSRDGKRLAIGRGPREISVYDLVAPNGPRFVRSIIAQASGGHGHRALAWLPDGRTLAAGSGLGNVSLLDADDDKVQPRLIWKGPGPSGDVDAIGVSADGKRLVAVRYDKGSNTYEVCGFDLSAPDARETFKLAAIPDFRALTLNASGDRLVLLIAANKKKGELVVWDLAAGQPKDIQRMEVPSDSRYLQFSGDGKSLFVAGKEGQIWGFTDKLTEVRNRYENGAAAAPDLAHIFVHKNGRLGIMDREGKMLIEPPAAYTDAVAVGGGLVTCSLPPTIWKVKEGTFKAMPTKVVPPYNDPIISLVYNPIAGPSGKLFVGGRPSAHPDVRALEGDTLLEQYEFPQMGVVRTNVFSWQPDRQVLFTLNYSGILERFDFTGEKPQRDELGKAYEQQGYGWLAVAPGGKMFAIKPPGSQQYSVYTLVNGKLIVTPLPLEDDMGVHSAAFTPDGRGLLVSYSSSTGPKHRRLIKRYDLGQPKTPGEILLEDPGISFFALSPDGSRLLAIEEYQATVWDLRTRAVIVRIPNAHQINMLKYYRWADDSRHIVMNQDGLVYIIRLAEAPPAGSASPLDALDPAAIPVAERFDWQPKELVAVLGDHRQRLWAIPKSMSLTADGKTLLTNNLLWDVKEQRVVRTLAPHPSNTGLLSPDGKFFVEGGYATDMATGKKTEIGAHVSHQMTFSQDSKLLLTGGNQEDPLRIWDLMALRAEPIAELEKCHTFALSPDNKTLVLADAKESRLVVFDLSMTPFRKKFEFDKGVGGSSHPVTFLSPTRLLTVDKDELLQLWDVSGKEFRELARKPVGKNKDAHNLGHAQQDRRFLVWDQGRVQFWEVENDQLVFKKELNFSGGGSGKHDLVEGNLLLVALTPNGETLITGRLNGAIQFWNTATDPIEEIQPLRPQPLAPFRGRPMLHFAGSTGPLALYDEKDSTSLWNFSGPSPLPVSMPTEVASRFRPISVSADGKSILVFSYSDPVSRSRLLSRTGDKFALTATFVKGYDFGSFSADGKCLAVCDYNRRNVEIWDLGAGKPQMRLHHPLGSMKESTVSLSPDGTTLVIGERSDQNSKVDIWTVGDKDLQNHRTIHYQFLRTMPPVLAPDGKTLLLGALLSGQSELWDISQNPPKKLPATFPKYLGGYPVAHFLADVNLCALADDKGKVGIWDFQKQAWKWQAQLPGEVHHIAATPDGRYLITGNGNRTVYIFRTDDGKKGPAE